MYSSVASETAGAALRRCWIGLLVLLLGALPAPHALADPSAEELAVARELFEKAQAAETEEDWVACEQFVSDAIAIIETPGLRFHLAYCKEHQGRWVEALVDYKRANELVSTGVEAPDVAELLGPAIDELEENLPKLTLLMEDVPEGTTLFLDGQERSTHLLGKPIPVDPGGRRVSVAAPGYHPFSQHINLLSKERRQLNIKLAPKVEAAVAASPSETASHHTSENVGTAGISPKTLVLIAEAAVTVAGLGTGVFYSAEQAQLERNRTKLLDLIGSGSCAANAAERHPSCDALAQTNDDSDLATSLALAGYVTAGVGVTAFVATWLLWEPGPAERAQSGRRPNSDVTALRLRVQHLPGGAFGALRGQF